MKDFEPLPTISEFSSDDILKFEAKEEAREKLDKYLEKVRKQSLEKIENNTMSKLDTLG